MLDKFGIFVYDVLDMTNFIKIPAGLINLDFVIGIYPITKDSLYLLETTYEGQNTEISKSIKGSGYKFDFKNSYFSLCSGQRIGEDEVLLYAILVQYGQQARKHFCSTYTGKSIIDELNVL